MKGTPVHQVTDIVPTLDTLTEAMEVHLTYWVKWQWDTKARPLYNVLRYVTLPWFAGWVLYSSESDFTPDFPTVYGMERIRPIMAAMDQRAVPYDYTVVQ